jgi:demethylmenaquinone methyltransferase/2-methoxy-6-polyprenyl-1,4-benzoquinol methylase
MPDPIAVNTMFARIAARYDVANLLLSGGVDRWWRWRLVRAVVKTKPNALLDLATGSGDVAFALARTLPAGVRILGVDFCQPMLDQAIAKQKVRTQGTDIEFRQGDALALPFAAESFDAVTIAFGLRNVEDRDRALCEMRRVLRPGGKLHVLEFSQPTGWFRPLYYFYTKRLLPSIAGWLTGDRAAYAYLNASIEAYPGHAAMSQELRNAGFREVTCARLTLGIVALHSGTR